MDLALAQEERLFWTAFWMRDRSVSRDFNDCNRSLSGYHIKALVENAELEITTFANRLKATGYPPWDVNMRACAMFAEFAADKRMVGRTWPEVSKVVLERELTRASGNLRDYLKAADLLRRRASDGSQPEHSRAPSVKSGRPPSTEIILAKADEMKALGLTTYQIATMMPKEPGFENVAVTELRDLIKGRYRPSGRPKKQGS